jgi:SAM-dependent methyltransferase
MVSNLCSNLKNPYREPVSWMHFEQMAEEYDSVRPPYPDALFAVLEAEGVIGPEVSVLEIGAGSGLATRQLVRAGCQVTALEPGTSLADLLERAMPGTPVLRCRLEDADLGDASFDSAVAATSMHWVDLPVCLPRLHAAIRPGGSLAVFRHVFGGRDVPTEFRRRVQQIVDRRSKRPTEGERESAPTMGELTLGALFRPVRSQRWAWTIELSTPRVVQLFRTFSDWTEPEVQLVGDAADACGGRVTEHYQSVLHLLRRD